MQKKWDIPDEIVMYVKEAYKNLYYKSRELNVPEEMQDDFLNKLVNKAFIEKFEKLKHEGVLTEGLDHTFFKDLQEQFAEWKVEFREGRG